MYEAQAARKSEMVHSSLAASDDDGQSLLTRASALDLVQYIVASCILDECSSWVPKHVNGAPVHGNQRESPLETRLPMLRGPGIQSFCRWCRPNCLCVVPAQRQWSGLHIAIALVHRMFGS